MTVSGPGCTAKHANAPSWSTKPHQSGKPHEDGLQSIARPGFADGNNPGFHGRASRGHQGKSVTAQTPGRAPQAPSTRIDQRGSAPELLVLRGSGGGKESVSFSD